MINQCSSCGCFCKKSGCERENVKPTSQPTQVKLTDDEIFKIYIAVIGEVYKNPLSNDPMEQQAAISFARDIESAHGIKE
jgi:hypothetical protein